MGFSAEAFGRPVDVESGDFEAGCPSEINVDVSSCSRSEQVETTRTSPVGPLGWRDRETDRDTDSKTDRRPD